MHMVDWSELLEFPYCDEVGTPAGERGAPGDLAAQLKPGAITGLRLLGDGCYEIAGEFGTVSIIAERPILRLKGG